MKDEYKWFFQDGDDVNGDDDLGSDDPDTMPM
jgi:hypothetical protein